MAIVIALVVTAYGAYRAFSASDPAWGIAMILGFFVAVGWLIAIVYLMTHRSAAQRPQIDEPGSSGAGRE